MNFVLDQTEAYRADGQSVVISGDFNAQPDYGRLNNWYPSPCAAVEPRSKVDLIFVTEDRIAGT